MKTTIPVTFPDFSGSASPQGVDKGRLAATAEEGTARKPVCAKAEGNDSRSISRKKNGRDSRRDGTTFPAGVAAGQPERPEAAGETPPGFCRCGADFTRLVERVAKLESLVAGAQVPPNHFAATAGGIVDRVAFALKLTPKSIRSVCRKTYMVEARSLCAAMMLAAGFKQRQIADALAWGHESAVHYAAKRHKEMIETLPHYRAAWAMIQKEFSQTNQPNQTK